MVHLCWLLMWFEVISRLKINLEKAERILITGLASVEELLMKLSCNVGELPSTYLGLPLGASFR